MTDDNRREQLIDIIKREFIGPDPLDIEGHTQSNGEEILTSDPPRIRYSAGILFPDHIRPVMTQEISEEEIAMNNEGLNADEPEVSGESENKQNGLYEFLEDKEEMLNLSNAYHQSAISLTAAINMNQKVYVKVNAGQYTRLTTQDPTTGKDILRYPRTALYWENNGNEIVFPLKGEKPKEYSIECGRAITNLKFVITYRYSVLGSGIYTFTLRNALKLEVDDSIKDEHCYFQVGFTLESGEAFPPLPNNPKININDEDYKSNQLLYRNARSYAIGHGCSADWEFEGGYVTKLKTEIFPTYEIKPIVPGTIQGVSLEMLKMSDVGDFNMCLDELNHLCLEYKKWIDRLKEKTIALDSVYKETAERHLKNCENCYQRMLGGLELLKIDENVKKAFQYMNRAMLLQQLHYNLPLQLWADGGNGEIELLNPVDSLPDLMDSSTWYGDQNRYGKWRPFQLAFVLINLKAMSDNTCTDRNEVDLIWFPTGGGKTEAYLGLSAYTIFIRRLQNPEEDGTSILMRYTLRLLTAQQYERAAAMICACDIIRNEKEQELGKSRITIGLWVGGDTTPNKMSDAVKAYNDLYAGRKDDNPFIMLKCPWCGAQMGAVALNKKSERRTPGYKKAGRSEVIFQCANKNCDFSHDHFRLPLMVVDESIYDNPPTLLLGTVDKFAMLPYKPQAQRIFGISGHDRKAPPALIIQDELHLISGPLGSMVGHYETMIHELCTDRRYGKEIRPKVIASTATISRAKEQCNALYNCGINHVSQFPPSGLDAGDSFFAVEDAASVGRKYVGVLAAGSSSYAMTSIRLYAALLYGAKAIDVKNESERDPYWTNVGYFNSIRELGQAATWIHADIDEYLHTIYKRRYEDKKDGYKDRRYIWRDEELTSRIRSDKIPMSLQNLGIKYPSAEVDSRPVDICLATNMISVGVDVPRLGLMTVVGQPKTTSEYIQATSRVGRSKEAPGIIFTAYHPGKPRDKSHYEHFVTYHSRVYCQVEPTSVTPFSAPLRERVLHAVLIGLVRLLGTPDTYIDPKIFPSDAEMNRLFSLIEDRVKGIDADELEHTHRHLEEIIEDWHNQLPQIYQDFMAEDIVPLMYPAGTKPNIEWDGRGMPTPTSMRSVDASCEAYVLKKYSVEVD